MPQSESAEKWSLLPLFAGLFVACFAAANAIGTWVTAPQYELALYLTITVGLTTSFLAKTSKLSISFLGPLVIVGAFAAFVVRWADLGVVRILYPTEVLAEANSALAALIGWTMAGLCFIQSRRENITLCLVSGLAIFGLMAVVNLSVVTLVLFTIYLAGAVYTFGYHNLLSLQTINSRAQQLPSWRRVACSQLIPTAVLVLAVTVAATGTGRALYELSPSLFGRTRLSWRWPGIHHTKYTLSLSDLWAGGGRTNLSKEVVMTVRSPQPALWRGQVYDTYQGRSWYTRQTSIAAARRASDGSYYLVDLNSTPGRLLEQTFTLTRISSPLLYAAAHPAVLKLSDRTIVPKDRASVFRQGSGAVYVAPPLPLGSTYQVISVIPDFSTQQLRSAGTNYPSEMFAQLYMRQIPLSVESELGELVNKITAQAPTAYDKVLQIMGFLAEDYLYTESPPVTPPNVDSVVHFVKSSKRGDCTQFASAMTMMCRLAGMPARVATGYSPGEYDPERGVYVVRGEDAHAWTEVYFPGCGWVPFDLQPSQRLDEQSFFSLWSRGHFRLLVTTISRVAAYVAAALAALALLSALFVDFSSVRCWWAALRKRGGPRAQLDHQWRRFYRTALRGTDIQPTSAHTPGELLAATLATKQLPEHIVGALRQATADLYELQYSPCPTTASQVERLRRRWQHLHKRI